MFVVGSVLEKNVLAHFLRSVSPLKLLFWLDVLWFRFIKSCESIYHQAAVSYYCNQALLLWTVHMEKTKDELHQSSNEFKTPVIQLQGRVNMFNTEKSYLEGLQCITNNIIIN